MLFTSIYNGNNPVSQFTLHSGCKMLVALVAIAAKFPWHRLLSLSKAFREGLGHGIASAEAAHAWSHAWSTCRASVSVGWLLSKFPFFVHMFHHIWKILEAHVSISQRRMLNTGSIGFNMFLYHFLPQKISKVSISLGTACAACWKPCLACPCRSCDRTWPWRRSWW